MVNSDSGYESFVALGDVIVTFAKIPQMPSYRSKRANRNGITFVKIEVGRSTAKTATDLIAVLRPHAWLMVGHCAGLRSKQNLGDFVPAHSCVS